MGKTHAGDNVLWKIWMKGTAVITGMIKQGKELKVIDMTSEESY